MTPIVSGVNMLNAINLVHKDVARASQGLLFQTKKIILLHKGVMSRARNVSMLFMTTMLVPNHIQSQICKGREGVMGPHGILTPFSGCGMADHVYHDGDCCHYRALANGTQIKNMDVIYVEHSALSRFVSQMLPSILSRFILITGKYELFKGITPKTVEAIIRSKQVIHWYTMNPWFRHPKVSGWPYGIVNAVMYSKALDVTMHNPPLRTQGVFKSHLGIGHRPWRIGVPSGQRLKLPEYYRMIASHTHMLSPNGDRPDCYRHYEALGLGTTPITELHSDLYSFFDGSGLLYAQDVHNWTADTEHRPQVNTSIVYEATWRRLLQTAIATKQYPIRL